MAENRLRIDPEAMLAGIQQQAEESWTGNPYLDALAGIVVPMARDTAKYTLAGGRYINDLVYGANDISAAVNWADQQTAGMNYEMGPAGQQLVGDLANQLMNSEVGQDIQRGYNNGFMGIKGAVDSGIPQAAWNKVPQYVKDATNVVGSWLDVATLPASLGAGAIVKAGKTADTIGDVLDAARKTSNELKRDERLAEIYRNRTPLDDYENDVNFIQADTIDYSIDDRLGNRKLTGQYRGAPRHVDTPYKLGQMRSNLKRLAILGAPGRLWYDRSTAVTTANSGGRPRYKHLQAGVNAITSRGAKVPVNQNFGVKGYNQVVTGNKVETGRFPQSQSEAIETLASGTPYEGGPKETPFFEALTIDDRPAGVRPTNDIWQARAFGYTKPNPDYVDGGDMPEFIDWDVGMSPAQHRFMDKETQKLVKLANKEKWAGYDDWTPERMQAAMWVGVKSEFEGISVAKAAEDFADNLENLTGSFRYEIRPDTTLKHMENVSGTPEYSNMHMSVNRDPSGRDRVALQAGAQVQEDVQGFGNYGGKTSASNEVRIMAAPESNSVVMDESSQALVRSTGAVHGLVEGQETIGLTFHRNSKTGDTRNSARVRLPSGTPDADTMKKITQAIDNEFGPDAGVYVMHTEDGIHIINESGTRIPASRLDKPITPGQPIEHSQQVLREGGISDRDFRSGVVRIMKQYGGDNLRVGTNTGGLIGNTDFTGYKPSRWMEEIDAQPLSQTAKDRLERGAMDSARVHQELDNLIEQSVKNTGSQDPILVLAREILMTRGFQGIRDAVAKGALPVVILGVLGLQDPATDEPGPQRL